MSRGILKDGEKTGLQVQLERASDEAGTAELLQITCSEAKLMADVGLAFLENVTLRIPLEDREITASGRVHWVAPVEEDRWFVWCKLEPLPDDVQRALADASKLERRHWPRLPENTTGTACWELETDWFPVAIKNVSADGCCLQSPQRGEVGRRLLIRPVDSRGTMLATVKWQREDRDEYRLGCQVLCQLASS